MRELYGSMYRVLLSRRLESYLLNDQLHVQQSTPYMEVIRIGCVHGA